MSRAWVEGLVCLSVSAIKDVPASIRERLALNPQLRQFALKDWVARARQKDNRAGLFYLGTCHRIELYGFEVDTSFLLTEWQRLTSADVSHFCVHRGRDCLRHWIRVCASLESEVLGETQITGQMKEAYEEAREYGFLAGPLDRFSQRVLSASKVVRSSLPLGEGTVSVAHVAVEGLKDFFEDLSDKPILIIGAGSMAQQSIHKLKQLGATRISWVNRSEGRITDSGLLGGGIEKLDYSRLHEHIWSHSITISATSSHTKIIEEAKLKKAKPSHLSSTGPRVILDLGLPRNVAEEIHGQWGIFVRDVDEFTNIAEENSEKRRKYMELAEVLTEQELLKILESTKGWSQVPLITEVIDLFKDKKEEDLQRFQLEKSADIEYITGNIYSNLLHGILKEVERLDEQAAEKFLQNIVRAWRHSGKWRQRQRAEPRRKSPQKNL